MTKSFFILPHRWDADWWPSPQALRAALADRRRWNAINAFPDFCARCCLHESEHASGRCLLALTRFEAR